MTEAENNIVINGITPNAAAFGGFSFCASEITFSLTPEIGVSASTNRIIAPALPDAQHFTLFVKEGNSGYRLQDGVLRKFPRLTVTVATYSMVRARARVEMRLMPERRRVPLSVNAAYRFSQAGGWRL